MASFQAKTCWERLRKREKKLSFRSVPTQPIIENSKKIAKKFKNTIMASLQAKTGWHRLRKRENKTYCFDQFQSNLEQRIPKKIKKLKKKPVCFFSSQNRQGKAEKERK